MVIVASLFAIALMIGFVIALHFFDNIFQSYRKNKKALEKKLKEYNKPYLCSCGIVSRYYQLLGEYKSKCPHCNDSINHSSRRVKDIREFPFAPQLNIKSLRKHITKENSMEKIKKDMSDLEATDKEIEAWHKLQLKKIAEYEAKAEELKKELLAKQ